MALLVKERKALEAVETSLHDYYSIFLGVKVDFDREKSIEERLLYIKVYIDGLLNSL